MPLQTIEAVGAPHPESLDSKFGEFDPTVRPFAVEQGYEEWGDTANLIVSTLANKIFAHNRAGDISHDEETEALAYGWDVLRSACELGYLSRSLFPEAEVNHKLGDKTAAAILGEDYKRFVDKHTATLQLLDLFYNRLPFLGYDVRLPFPPSTGRNMVLEWANLVARLAPSVQRVEQLEQVQSDPRNIDGQPWENARAQRIMAVRWLRDSLLIIAKQGYLWGRTGSVHFLNPRAETVSTVVHHGGLITTDIDLENKRVEAALKGFDDSANLPTYNFLGKIGLWREGRRHQLRSGLYSRHSYSDEKWTRESIQRNANRDAERKRLHQEFRTNPLAI